MAWPGVVIGLVLLVVGSNAAGDKQQVCADLVGAGGVGVRVWPTVQASPRGPPTKLRFRLLQINWEAEEVFDGDWVGVFDRNPKQPLVRSPSDDDPSGRSMFWDLPLYWDTPYATRGTVTSNVTQHRPDVGTLAGGGCVGLWVGYVRNGVCIAAECLASHPSWLWDNKDVLGSRSLRSLMLPGTHNAGSYSLRDLNDVVTAWVVCQDEDIISQLLYGIRYLDLRVGYYRDTPELLWINHDLVRWRPLLEVLSQIRGFLALSPDPIIIDIHRMPVGFERPEAMSLLMSLLNTTFGPECLSQRYGPQVTLDQVWATGKRVIFAFADIDVSEEVDWVWPPLPQAWANAQTLADLRGYLDIQMARRAASPRLWAAMGHLTPTLWDLLLRSHVGVRGMADRANAVITTWLQKRWAHLANIVASDFFNGNDIVNVAIRTNLALSVCPSSGMHHAPSPLRRSTTVRLSEAPRRLPNPIWETIKNFEEDLPLAATSPSPSLQPPLFRGLTSTTPPYQRITTSFRSEETSPPYQRVTTPPYQRVTTPTYFSTEAAATTTAVEVSSTATSTTLTPPTTTTMSPKIPEASDDTSDVAPSPSVGLVEDRAVDGPEYSLVSPIQSILSLFGLNATVFSLNKPHDAVTSGPQDAASSGPELATRGSTPFPTTTSPRPRNLHLVDQSTGARLRVEISESASLDTISPIAPASHAPRNNIQSTSHDGLHQNTIRLPRRRDSMHQSTTR